MNNFDLDIIVPCYNPILGWEKDLCQNFLSFCNLFKEDNIRLILVNDGSVKNVSPLEINFLSNSIKNFIFIDSKKNKGKGSALRIGVKKSTAEMVIFTDIDFPYTLKSMENVYKSLCNGADVSLGSRDLQYYEKTPFIRRIISKNFRVLMKFSLNLKASDTQCGLKGFKSKGKEIFLKTTINRFLFDLEFVKECSAKKDLKIDVVPVFLKEGVTFSQMNFKILMTESLNFIYIIFKRKI